MAQLEMNGLATADKLYGQYGLRARELKAQGRKVIGYLSALGPVEIITASGAVPVRLKGWANEPITKANAYMETIVCPFVRNVFDSALKGKYDFLDGIVMSHLCDSTDRTSDVWNYNLQLPYWHFIDVPHVTDNPSVDFFKSILRFFIASLEKYTGQKITDEALTKAVKAHNENRALMRELYDLRKSNPPAISGSEMTKVLIAAMSLPVEESSALIRSVIEEVKKRVVPSNGKKPRVMIVGAQIDSVEVIELIESAGASVVMDELSMGSKIYWSDVDVTDDPVQGIAERYLRKLKLPTTFVDAGDTYEENLDARLGFLKEHVKEFQVDAAILLIYKYCDPYGFEVPAMKSCIESTGASVLYMEDEYSLSSLPRMKTRVEAFLEMIAQ